MDAIINFFKNIIMFFKLFFFLETILLVSNININSEYTFIPEKTLKTINGAASIQIDITNMISGNRDGQYIQNMFPLGSIYAELYFNNKHVTTLEYDKGIAYAKDYVALILRDKTSSLLPDTKINKIIIKTNIKLLQVNIYWQNGSI